MAEVPFLSPGEIEEDKKQEMDVDTPKSQEEKIQELLLMGFD